MSSTFPEDKAEFGRLIELFAQDEAMREAASSVHYPSARVSFTVGYWRKANQIHSWFVRECQDGRDECQITHVSRDKLRELRDVCLRVLVDRNDELADELLAPQGGFFFGSVDYNDWYWSDLKETVQQLDRALALSGSWTLYYQSSW